MSKNFILLSRVGRNSLHQLWLNGPREFDILLSAYEPTDLPESNSGVYIEHRNGNKISGYAQIFREHSFILKEYDYIALFDDDIHTDSCTTNAAFKISEEKNLKISQPALTRDSFFTYAATLQQKECRVRYVNFIEEMCPIIRSDVLIKIMPLFNFGVESGLDLAWCNIAYDSPHDFAILDETPVHHTRPVGLNKSARGFVNGRRYEDDIYKVLDRFDLPWLNCVPYAAEMHDGSTVTKRSALLRAALPILLAKPAGRGPQYQLRQKMDHWRHILTRPARNLPRAIERYIPQDDRSASG